MKKKIVFLYLLVILIFLCSCGKTSETQEYTIDEFLQQWSQVYSKASEEVQYETEDVINEKLFESLKKYGKEVNFKQGKEVIINGKLKQYPNSTVDGIEVCTFILYGNNAPEVQNLDYILCAGPKENFSDREKIGQYLNGEKNVKVKGKILANKNNCDIVLSDLEIIVTE